MCRACLVGYGRRVPFLTSLGRPRVIITSLHVEGSNYAHWRSSLAPPPLGHGDRHSWYMGALKHKKFTCICLATSSIIITMNGFDVKKALEMRVLRLKILMMNVFRKSTEQRLNMFFRTRKSAIMFTIKGLSSINLKWNQQIYELLYRITLLCCH